MSLPSRYSAEIRAALDAKVAFLSSCDAYPGEAVKPQVVETHMSWVFLTERHAYKLKKPVRDGYLDFSTVDARHRDCERELALNRRLAPQVYLAILPLTIDPQGRMTLGGSGSGIDWLVKMVRLPRERMLDRLILAGGIRDDELRDLGQHLAVFYGGGAPIEITRAEYRQRITDDVRDNERDLTEPRYGLPAARAASVARAQLRFLATNAALFDERVEKSKIVEAHGDLRPEHVCVLPRPQIIDCLEFARGLRILDPLDELCSLAADCERHGAAHVAALIIESYCAVAGDGAAEPLLRFYRCFRACVRARIAIRHLRDEPATDAGRWVRRALEYLDVAQRHAGNLG